MYDTDYVIAIVVYWEFREMLLERFIVLYKHGVDIEKVLINVRGSIQLEDLVMSDMKWRRL